MPTLPQLMSRCLAAVPYVWRARVKRVPLVGALQRWATSAALDGRPFVHLSDAGPARGMRFLVQLPEDKGIWTGTYEADFAAAVAAGVRPGAICYDIGGWHGYFAAIMAAQGAAAVHVFEPMPGNGDRIARLAALNPKVAIHLHRMAVGDRDGEAELRLMPESSMAKIADSPFQPEMVAAEAIRVPLARLDTLVAAGSVPPPDLIKLDIEGAELMALRGALDVLGRHRPVIFAEVHSAALLADCERLLAAVGYRIDRIARTADAGPVHIRATAA
ncbi:MAG: FkbM family methyltransferase [Thiohalocapsa sp.]